MAGNADEDPRRGVVEDNRGGKKQKKDVGSTTGGGKKKDNDPFNLKDLAKSLPGNVDRNPQVSDRKLRMPASSSENVAGDPTSGKNLPGKNPQVSDRNLRIPASSSENVAGDPTSGKSLPGNVASTTDFPEKVGAGTWRRNPEVRNRLLWMAVKGEKSVNIDTSASHSENVAGDPSGTPTSSSENTASNVGRISLRRSSRLANPSGTPTSNSENTASDVGGISLRRASKL